MPMIQNEVQVNLWLRLLLDKQPVERLIAPGPVGWGDEA
jgi:hypothetical protein